MIATYAHQKALRQEREELKTAQVQFRNLIVAGTNCSDFESEVITEKAQECFRLGAYAEGHVLQPGQIVWMAVSQDAPPGKPLRDCPMVRVVLTLHNDEDRALWHTGAGAGVIRRQQLVRVATEALEQGGLLTQEDLARLLGRDPRTIRHDVRKLKDRNILLPTRGPQKDIGPSVTHKVRAIECFLQGKEPLQIARDLQHSLKAVERYITTFCRVIYCQRQVHNTLKTALIVGVSVRAVQDCLDIQHRYCRKACFQERLESIRSTGKAFWEAQDFKKKGSRNGRRRS